MYPDLAEQVAVITGAGSGIGRACAIRLAHEGCRLILNDLRADAAEATRTQLCAPERAQVVIGDMGDPATAPALAQAAMKHFSPVQIWVNNAAHIGWGAVAETENETWDATLQVTLTGAFYGVRAALAAMHQGGCIINIASGAALGGEPGLGAYAAAKAGLVNLTRTTAVENAARGIRSNAILPGPIATPPMLAAADASSGGRAGWEAQLVVAQRFGTPEEVANAVCFLASSQASYINGVALSVDGGLSARTQSPAFTP